MGTIPATPTFTTSTVLSAADLNSVCDAIDFWADPPRCNVYRATTQSVSSGSYDLITWDAEDLDKVQSGDSPMHDLSTNPGRVYIRTAGRYQIDGQVTWSDNSSSTRRHRVRLNSAGSSTGGTLLLETAQDPLSGIATAVPLPPVEHQLAAGDYIEVFGYQASGSTLTITAGYGVSYLRVRLVAP